MAAPDSFDQLASDIVGCRKCPRLVEWRERVAVEKKAAFADDTYHGAGVPGFGDPNARLMVLGLAPAAHGANRTGRMFTGDRSGDWLFRSMHRAGFASQPTSTHRGDGLELRDAWVTSPVHCAPPGNAPTSTERANCAPYLLRELALLSNLQVIVALGGVGFASAARALDISPRPKFGHGARAVASNGIVLMGCFHVSQLNTFTGRLTEEMLDEVFADAAAVLSVSG